MIEIISFKDGKEKVYKLDDKTIISLGLVYVALQSDKVYANSISNALKPLINVLQDLAEPVSYGFMIKGFLQVMAGDDHAGQKTIKSAIGGYLGIQFIPRIFEVIRGIKF